MSQNIIEDEGVPQSRLDDILRKVQGLLSKADHANTSETEADAYRAKAEELMKRFKIEESELMMADPASAMRPVMKTWSVCEYNSPYYQEFYWLMGSCARHAGARMTYQYGPDPDNDGKHSLLAKLVGYESDVRYATLLYATLRMQFSSKMEPKVDPSLSDEDNVYNLRSAGIERWRIAGMMGWGGPTDGPSHARVTKTYRRACEQRGEDPVLTGKGNSVALYRKSFAMSFVTTIDNRLYRASAQSGVGNAGEMVLASRKENVDEAFYEFFPDLRPKPAGTSVATAGKSRGGRTRRYVAPKQSSLGLRAGRQAAETADLTPRATAQKPRGLA